MEAYEIGYLLCSLFWSRANHHDLVALAVSRRCTAADAPYDLDSQARSSLFFDVIIILCRQIYYAYGIVSPFSHANKRLKLCMQFTFLKA